MYIEMCLIVALKGEASC